MEAQPLSKKIYDKAKELGVTEIHLNFSGGHDEGYLRVQLFSPTDWNELRELTNEIEEWAWNVYHYSGAGDGNDYGDDIVYDLDTGTVTVSEWYTSRVDGDSNKSHFDIREE